MSPFTLRHDGILPVVGIQLAAVPQSLNRIRMNLGEFSRAQVVTRSCVVCVAADLGMPHAPPGPGMKQGPLPGAAVGGHELAALGIARPSHRFFVIRCTDDRYVITTGHARRDCVVAMRQGTRVVARDVYDYGGRSDWSQDTACEACSVSREADRRGRGAWEASAGIEALVGTALFDGMCWSSVGRPVVLVSTWTRGRGSAG